jgi:hypothetical protein
MITIATSSHRRPPRRHIDLNIPRLLNYIVALYLIWSACAPMPSITSFDDIDQGCGARRAAISNGQVGVAPGTINT